MCCYYCMIIMIMMMALLLLLIIIITVMSSFLGAREVRHAWRVNSIFMCCLLPGSKLQARCSLYVICVWYSRPPNPIPIMKAHAYLNFCW